MEEERSLIEVYNLGEGAEGRIRGALGAIGSTVIEADYHTEVVEKLRELLATMELDEFLIAVALSINALVQFAAEGFGDNLPPEVRNTN